MAKYVPANNAVTTLTADITNVATTITVSDGSVFPAISVSGDYYYLTLVNSSKQLEIVKCTARSTNTLTVTRGAESSTQRAFSSGDSIALRLTSGAISDIIGDNMTRESNTVAYLGATQFTVTATGEDLTSIYHQYRAVVVKDASSESWGYISASSYNGSDTTTVTCDATVMNPLVAVEYGVAVAEAPELSNAATLNGVADTGFVKTGVASTVTVDTTWNDGKKVTLGTGADATLYHDGSNLNLTNSAGDFLVDTDVEVQDSKELSFGDDADWSLVHDGANKIKLNSVLQIKKADSETIMTMTPDAGIEFYYDNDKKGEIASNGYLGKSEVHKPGSDQDWYGPSKNMTVDTGYTFSFGDIGVLASGSGKLVKADADVNLTSEGDLFVCVEASVASNASGQFGTHGCYLRDDSWTDIGYGIPFFLSTTAGGWVETAPSGSGDRVRVVGFQGDDTKCRWFKPSEDFGVI